MAPSHHVLELHPAWSFESGEVKFGSSSLVYPTENYHGYGATKFKPLLNSIQDDEWPKVDEDEDFVYVQMFKEENFYQLPVAVKSIKEVTGGKEAVVDVFGDSDYQNLVYSDLAVIAADGTEIADKLAVGQKTFLLGFFSVTLRKAMTAAEGHAGEESAVFAPQALEFFTFGFPKQKAVSSSKVAACKK